VERYLIKIVYKIEVDIAKHIYLYIKTYKVKVKMKINQPKYTHITIKGWFLRCNIIM